MCQDAALRRAAESGIPRSILVISDRSLPVLLSNDQGEIWSHGLRYKYADNFGVVGNTEANATEAYNMIAKSMIRVGIHVHDEVRAICDAETLGVRLRFDTDVATVSIERGWRLRGGCREFAQRKRTRGRRHENIMGGHQTFASLLARWSLSILFASYKLARAAYVEPLQTWRSVPCLVANLVSHGLKLVRARMLARQDALSRCDLRLCTTYLSSVASGKTSS